VNHSALAAVHGIEPERSARAFDFFRSRGRAQPQLFDAQQAIVIGVERNARVIFGRQPQRFHSHMLERQQQLGAVAEQQIHIAPAEFHHHLGSLEVVLRGLPVGHLELYIHARAAE
jgi:hypothetical protein